MILDGCFDTRNEDGINYMSGCTVFAKLCSAHRDWSGIRNLIRTMIFGTTQKMRFKKTKKTNKNVYDITSYCWDKITQNPLGIVLERLGPHVILA